MRSRKFSRRSNSGDRGSPISTGPARVIFQKPDPAQDQRANDALAEIGLGDDQRAQLVRRDEQRLEVVLRMRIDERVAAGERRNLGDEVTGAARGERPHMTQAISLAEGDRAAQDDEHAGLPVRPPRRVARLARRCEPCRTGGCGRLRAP